MKIELLQGVFPVNKNPGLDSTDPRLDEIATLVQIGKHAEAASRSEELLASGVYDIRLICYFLYGHWLENGLLSLFDIINCLNNILLENWEAIGPVTKREKNSEKSLDWLLKQLLKKIQYEEGKNSAIWNQWQSLYNSDQMSNILELSETSFRSNINLRLEDTCENIIALWSKIEEWLRVFQQLMTPEPEPIQPEKIEPEQVETEQIEAKKDYDIFSIAVRSSTGLEIESSYHMELLLKKLAGFERLLQEEKFPRAALLAVDINGTIENFDPKLYFPKILEAFIRLQALNFEELAAYKENQHSTQWQVMQDWLKVDIDSFINY
ncbi:MAG: hypothetical protein RI893_1526 [Pseudomonadota bacterium]|jgi:hypothetical protein